VEPQWPERVRRVACAVGGLILGYFLWHHAPVVEGEAIARDLPSGAKALQRDPSTPVPPPVARAATELHGKLERAGSITVQSKPIVHQAPPVAAAGIPAQEVSHPQPQACSCAPVTVDFGLVRMPDDTRRVVATSQDGEVVGGIDIPVASAQPARVLRWAAGVAYEPRRREYGAFIDRDLGPLRLGVQVERRNGSTATWVRAGIRW
jgi:hypothetical protein